MKRKILIAIFIIAICVCSLTVMVGCVSSDTFGTYKLNDDEESYTLISWKENTSQTEITIPDEYNGLPVTAIDMPGISNTSTLQKITIGANIEYIDAWALTLNTYLKEIVVDEDNQYYSSEDGILYDKAGTTLVLYPNAKQASYNSFGSLDATASDKTVVIKEGVTEIAKLAFYKCYAVDTIILPSTMEVIGTMAFMGTNITSIELNEGLTTICDNAFLNCSLLPVIDIPSTVTSIEEECFYGCSLLTVINIYASEGDVTFGNNWQPRVGGKDVKYTVNWL